MATALVRGRTIGSAIVSEAQRRQVEAIVIGAEPPSPIKGGGVLGGLAGARPKELGEITAYVLEKAPCRVLVTAPPSEGGIDSLDRGPRARLGLSPATGRVSRAPL